MNTCIFIGNLTREPELCVTPQTGTSICTFTIAVNRRKDANGESKADYIPIKCFKALAENCQKYLRKGSKVSVKGMLQTYTYQAKDGSRRNGFEVVVGMDGEVTFLSPVNNGNSSPLSSSEETNAVAGMTRVETDDLPF